MAVGSVIGPAVSGAVVAAAGSWAIRFDSFSYAVSAVFLVALRLPRAATWFVVAPFLVLAIPSVRHLRDGMSPYNAV